MRYYRCKCGKHTAWSSMGVAPCNGCDDCKTTLAEAPGEHDEIAPHDWREEFAIADPATGARKKERICLRCMTREPVTITVRVDDRDVEIAAVDLTVGQLMAMANVWPTNWLAIEKPSWSGPLAHDQMIELREGMAFKSGPPGHF